MMGAFKIALEAFAAQNIPVIPTQPDDPKEPMVKRPASFGIPAIRQLAAQPKYHDANAAICCGERSRLTVVDIDSPDDADLHEVIDIFGDTPLKARTPSGGLHLYFRYGGEKRIVRPFGRELPVDVLGSGIAVVPPSIRPPRTDKPGGQYEIVEGDLSLLPKLPAARSYPQTVGRHKASSTRLKSNPACVPEQKDMRDGDGRNQRLFDICRSIAKAKSEEDQYIQRVLQENTKFAEPMSEDEVLSIAHRVWGWKCDGRLFVAGDRPGFIRTSEERELFSNRSALALLVYIRGNHTARHVFAVVPEAIAPELFMASSTAWRARDFLVEQGYLEKVRNGVRKKDGRMSPNQYRLTTPHNEVE